MAHHLFKILPPIHLGTARQFSNFGWSVLGRELVDVNTTSVDDVSVTSVTSPEMDIMVDKRDCDLGVVVGTSVVVS